MPIRKSGNGRAGVVRRNVFRVRNLVIHPEHAMGVLATSLWDGGTYLLFHNKDAKNANEAVRKLEAEKRTQCFLPAWLTGISIRKDDGSTETYKLNAGNVFVADGCELAGSQDVENITCMDFDKKPVEVDAESLKGAKIVLVTFVRMYSLEADGSGCELGVGFFDERRTLNGNEIMSFYYQTPDEAAEKVVPLTTWTGVVDLVTKAVTENMESEDYSQSVLFRITQNSGRKRRSLTSVSLVSGRGKTPERRIYNILRSLSYAMRLTEKDLAGMDFSAYDLNLEIIPLHRLTVSSFAKQGSESLKTAVKKGFAFFTQPNSETGSEGGDALLTPVAMQVRTGKESGRWISRISPVGRQALGCDPEIYEGGLTAAMRGKYTEASGVVASGSDIPFAEALTAAGVPNVQEDAVWEDWQTIWSTRVEPHDPADDAAPSERAVEATEQEEMQFSSLDEVPF